ncbi:exodeoxyribonuclease VII large subunit [Bacillus cytotoxicus]|uniref:Exodeoxyribonuclease 7 large subunit n=2 Tax=Bacillus cytotoxicus TaxID=580165 RepID=EX7L_BACCN|nr:MULTISPECIES: exodeoxyribonuclease VII large subunit [Bacillus cereus group]A7GSJ8.1 RecName: Full=Exodeoxyribonuclease 7 large subunit; AltName: Full=Exodeoxyribonuclease VII large subunit; Short=Exonuclease VII large subunit [Bacillus cytotoxicus NVH 391-98]ABS23106.1 exodeoxyribonuclease VII, large subunit [Bacillus cytotoxicus NVH 391-98]AWC29756.1 exodeoxyribonuclease VII large subunit [Bacillus cytotoxicus]AWC41887.1 exodeoxyribonuclease VII large subunit [Bacillus cytotoxicus]AWC4573
MEKQYLTVTALTRYIKTKIEYDPHLQSVWLKGEISNFKYHSRGHMYFTLKDENARIAAVMFAGHNRNIKFRPEDGMKVLVKGKISVYEASGSYQIYVHDMQPDGVGNLHLAYEQLKVRLEEEGLFSRVYKQPIPAYAKTIGVITSPTGAAIRDIITTIKRRYPIGNVIVFPVLVQGEFAAPSIVQAIQTANEMNDIDVLIVGRGGGSIEELWAFNEEIVARAIFASKIPIISAVGHETDFTIADFVADLRAPTPTAAAELAVPNILEMQEKVLQRTLRLQRAMREIVHKRQERLQTLQKSYAFRYPRQIYEQKEEQLDRALEQLVLAKERYMEKKVNQLKQLSFYLEKHHPAQRISQTKIAIETLQKQLRREMQTVLQTKEFAFVRIAKQLEALSPLKVMMRGYGLVYSEKNQVLKSVKDVSAGDVVSVQLQDGILDCNVSSVKERESNGK